jgi:hypothetical protein
MTTSPVCVERRMGQRFTFNLPVSLRDVATSAEGLGFTQNLSSRGVFLFTGMALNEGAEVELTLRMPSEITLGENMRVRCRGRVLRVLVETGTAESGTAERKIGLAVCFNGYEYLTEAEDSSADFRRISALHGGSETERTTLPLSAIPRTATH